MIAALGFVDTSAFTAMFVVKHKARQEAGLLRLRDIKDGEESPTDLPILKEWKSARALLSRIRSGAAPFFDGKTPELGKAWIETLPPGSGTPWTLEEGDYAQEHVRLRICLIPAPDAWTMSGQAHLVLNVGMVNVVEHRVLHSEVNFSDHARTHLVVDVRRPDGE